MFYRLGFLSPVLPALSRQCLNPQISGMPESKCDLDMFAALLFSQQKQIIFPLLLNRYVGFSVFCFLLHFFKQQSPEEQLLSGSLARTIMLCNGDHLPAVNNIIYLVRQALVQCIWGPKAGFHQEQR